MKEIAAGSQPAGRVAANDNSVFGTCERNRELIELDPIRMHESSAADKDEPSAPPPAGVPRMAFRGEWVGDNFYPDMPQRRLHPIEIGEKRRAEKASMARARAAIARRQAIGDPDCAANDNDFPLLAALRREGDNDSIDHVLKYRQLTALCGAQPLQGLAYQATHGVGSLYRSTKLKGAEDVDAAAEAGWPSDRVPGGGIRYKEAKKLKGGHYDGGASKAVIANDETRVRTAPLAVKFNDKVLLAQIDAKPVLAALRAALGPLLAPFEDAVLGCKTYTEIGQARGFNVKPDVAGKALVKQAILAVEGTWHDIAISQRRKAKAADQRAGLRRCEIAVAQARYLGRAA